MIKKSIAMPQKKNSLEKLFCVNGNPMPFYVAYFTEASKLSKKIQAHGGKITGNKKKGFILAGTPAPGNSVSFLL